MSTVRELQKVGRILRPVNGQPPVFLEIGTHEYRADMIDRRIRAAYRDMLAAQSAWVP